MARTEVLESNDQGSWVGPEFPSLGSILLGMFLFATGGMLLLTVIFTPLGMLLLPLGVALLTTPKKRAG